MGRKMTDDFDIYNVKVDPQGRFVVIRINPRLYKQHIIMRAADDLIHGHKDYDVIIDGDPDTEIKAKFIPKSRKATREELLSVAYRFNTILVSCCGKG
ncbi:MAG: hypothetical protein B6U72_01590 [Candidatus Altiarchaeales archaeon ex4484_2]|nr:MAG: hypothetical protein B6U72_01590 [Candidatus Altiarchaeales archaeon ex4484_2]